MSCFMGYNPLVAKEVKITTWIKEFDGDSPVYPSFPNDGDCFVVFATDEDALTHNALSKKTYTNGDWADAEGGGGGGGDFNTAEVTVKGLNGENIFYLDIYKDDTGNFPAIFCTEDHFSDSAYTNDGTPTTYTLMYTGDSVTIAVGNAYASSTGDVVYNEDDNTVTISGDCSVTGWVED